MMSSQPATHNQSSRPQIIILKPRKGGSYVEGVFTFFGAATETTSSKATTNFHHRNRPRTTAKASRRKPAIDRTRTKQRTSGTESRLSILRKPLPRSLTRKCIRFLSSLRPRKRNKNNKQNTFQKLFNPC